MSDINVQTFSGKVKVSNDLTVTTNVHADYFKGDGSLLTNLPSGSGGVWNTNSDNEIYFISSNVGISNADPGHNLSVGSNLYVDDDGSNVLVVTGNVKADYFKGDGSLLTGLSGSGGVWSTNGDGEIYFINSNVGISNADPGHNLSVGSNLYVDDDGSNVLVVTGNVKADYFVGNGSLLTNLPSGSGGVWSTNGDGEIYFINSNVGISNADPGHNLSVGSNLYVDDDGSNVLVIDGNLTAESMTLGGIGIVPSYPLSSVTDTGNTTPHTIEFTNAETGIVVDSNIVVAGNVTAAFLYGDASNVTGIASNLHQVVENGNVTSNTVQFSNATTGLVTTANVSVGKDLTVSGNVTVDTDTLFVDSVNNRVGVGTTTPGTALHVVGDVNVVSNVNMLHTSNTASIKLNSNVVTEFPRSKKFIKYPRVALGTGGSPNSGTGGGYTLSGYTVKASDEYNTTDYTASKAFTNTNIGTGDTWISTGSAYTSADGLPVANSATVAKFGQNGSWIEVGLPNAIQLHSTRVLGRHTHFAERSDTADIWASNTGNDGDWVKLTTINFNDTYTDVIPMVADIDTQAYYQYFAIQITKIEWNGTYANIGEWELFGTPEYDPDADGTDVVVKSVPNVPNTDWLEVYYDAKDLVDGSITNVDDLTPNGTNDGTATNVTVSDGAFVFNGTSSLLESTTTITNSTGDIPHTFSLWVKPSDSDLDDTNNHYLIVYGTELNTGKWSGISISNKRFASVIHASVVRFGPEVRVGEWYHIVLNYKSGGIHNSERFDFFINGSQIDTTALSTAGSQAGSATLNLSSPAKLVLGGLFTGAERSSSTIANSRLFNRTLTSDEIYQLYAYQKEYFGHGDLGMTLKAGRLGIGTSEPKAALDVRGDVILTGNFSQIITGVGRVPIMGRISNTFLTTSPSILISDLPENVDIDRMKTAAYGAIVMMSGANISSAGKRTPGKYMGFGEVNQSSTYIELAYGFYDGTYTKIVGLRYDIGSSSKSITVKQTFAKYYQGNTTRYDTVSWTTQGSTPGSTNYGVKDLTIFY